LSTISQNNIVVNYVVTSDQIAKTKTEFDKLTDAEKKAVDETKKLNDQLKTTGQEGSKSVKGVGNEMNNLSSIAKSGAGLLAGFFALSAIKSFGQSVFNVTAEFEKMQAVLKNTLGSNSAAMLSMEAIKNFAKTTPFSVQELTASFIKLANQGFTPNIDQMKRLGDLASSTGKSFDQLTEAIIDAQVGEFERLKEFGVRAQKEGENVRFTFKGVETQVKNNNASIREYILSLGELNGVSGASAAISETLGGKVNNLGDAWDNFLNKIGTLLKPVLTEALTVTADFMDQINDLFGGAKSDAERFGVTELETYKAYQKTVLSLTDDQLVAFVAKQKDNLAKSQTDLIKYTKESLQYGKAVRAVAETGFGQKEIVDAIKLADTANQDIAAAKGRIAAAQEQINLREKATATTLQQKVGLTDAEIKALKARYDATLKLLEIEKRIADINIEVTTEREDERTLKLLRNEEAFGKKKLAIVKEFAGLGVVDAENNAKLQAAIVVKQGNDVKVELKKQSDGFRDAEEKYDKEQLEAAKKLEEAKQKARKASMDKSQDDAKEMMKQSEEISKKSIEDEYKRIQKAEEEKAAIIQATFDLAVQTTNGLFNLQSQYAARDMERKNKQFDQEIALADGNEQKIAEINEKRAIAEREYRIKEFRANQAAAVANIIFAAAPEIIKNIKNPVLLGLITAGVILQTGLVLAQPLPEFAEGTKGKPFKGRAIVGEKGTEKVVTQSGKVYYTPGVATLAQFDEPVQIIPNNQLGINDKRQLSLIYGNTSRTNDSGGRIIEKLSNIESGLKNMPVAAISLDERGFMKKVRTPSRSTTILNNRFKN
jgi:hypothetical protein